MSRSLSRIRNLISEIEEIQRLGQQGGQASVKAADRANALLIEAALESLPASTQASPVVEQVIAPVPVEAVEPTPIAAIAAIAPPTIPTPAITATAAPVIAQEAPKVQLAAVATEAPAEEKDPFAELDKVVSLDQKRTSKNEPVQEGKVHLQFTGSVSLSLQIVNTGEVVEVKQIGNMLEIRFADGKAFHLPLKAVA